LLTKNILITIRQQYTKFYYIFIIRKPTIITTISISITATTIITIISVFLRLFSEVDIVYIFFTNCSLFYLYLLISDLVLVVIDWSVFDNKIFILIICIDIVVVTVQLADIDISKIFPSIIFRKNRFLLIFYIYFYFWKKKF